MSLSTLLVLADGRLPSGGHAHSGGLEAAVAAGRVADVASLDGFLRGRLNTAGRVAAAFAAAACARTGEWSALDAGMDARTPSPALRAASRAQGRSLIRVARRMWPLGSAAPDGPRALLELIGREPHHAVAIGAVAAAAGLGSVEAAVAAAYGAVTAPASAAVRLLGLDPYAVHALLAALAPDCDRIAASAAERAFDPVDALPAAGAPLLDIGAEVHATWEVRLFAS
ncbi:MAG TPA: urease accessory UreF family protein [Actinoplanes sp.]|jgi:urease accessory protein